MLKKINKKFEKIFLLVQLNFSLNINILKYIYTYSVSP